MTFTELTPLIADFSKVIEINPQEAKASSVELPLIAKPVVPLRHIPHQPLAAGAMGRTAAPSWGWRMSGR
jgi:hypothetical protein